MAELNRDKKLFLPVVVNIDTLSKIYNFYEDKKINNHAYALSVYMFLYKTARMQNNIRTYANNEFIKKGVGISSEKLNQVKKDLKEMELIETIRPRDKNGQYTSKSYIEVKYVWKKETLHKLLYQESDEILKYKIAKNLLMSLYSDFENIEDNLIMHEIPLTIHNKEEVIDACSFYFEDNLLKGNTAFSGGEFNFTVPTDRVSEIILSLVSQEEYSFETINKILQMKS